MTAQADVAHYSQLLSARGFVANHDGNVSVRLSDNVRFLATPTATSKRLVAAHDTLTVDLSGKILSGRKKLFGEWHLHQAAYAARPDVRAVIHAHPPHASALAAAHKSLGVPAMPEVVVSLGKNIPTLPFALPKSSAQNEALARALTEADADAVLVAGNGVLAVGVDLEQAFLRLELVEHYARIVLLALPVGGVVPLRDADVEQLLLARHNAGLGQKARLPHTRG